MGLASAALGIRFADGMKVVRSQGKALSPDPAVTKKRAGMDPIPLSPLHPGYNSGPSIKRSALLYSDTQGVRVHDAQVLVQFVDRCMIFIPSREGRSHCPEEFTESIYRKRQHFARHRVGSRELTSPVSQRVRQHSTSKGVADGDHTDCQCQHCYSS